MRLSHALYLSVMTVCSSAAVIAQQTPPTAFVQKVTLNIPAQRVADSIRELGQQSGLTIIIESQLGRDATAPALIGTYSIAEALRKILPKNLHAEYLDQKTAAILASPGATTAVKATSPMRTASAAGMADVTSPATAGGTTVPVRVTLNADSGSNNGPASDVGDTSETVVITGSHIRGEAPAGSHVITIDRDTIDRSGYGRLEDLLAVLPQNFVGTSEIAAQQSVSNLGRGSEIQLRGLGPGTTLTLVDGQRGPSSGTQGAFVDISNIPTSAIERVEILPDGASALYGADAIGGVVNVILRKDYQGAETRVRFGEATGGQAKETELSQLFGTHWSSGHVLVGYQYTRRDDLIAASRPFLATSGNLVPFGGSDFRTVGGNPGEILNAKRQPAFGIPTAQDGMHLTVPQLLPGVVNYPDHSQSDVLPKQTMHSAFVTASQDVSDRAQLFLNARYNTRDVRVIGVGFKTTVRVPSSNPFYVNPFGGTGPVNVAYDFIRDLGPTIQDATEDTLMVTAGANMSLSTDWHLALSSSYARDSTVFNWLNLPNFSAITAALADSNPSTALNVFGDGSHTNPATLAAIRAPRSEQGINTTESAAVILDGSLFELPSGIARIAFGTEYRRDALRGMSHGVDSYSRLADGRRDFAGFAELAVPLISEAEHVPLVRKLELSIAGRYDNYNDVGSTTNPKLGVTWAIVNTLKLRGTWGKSFRAPPFYLADNNIQTTFVQSEVVADPLSPTGKSSVLFSSGTNPNLRPETAKTWTAGLDFEPLGNMLLSATYFNIDYSNKIQAPPDINPLTVESHYTNTGVIIRNPTQSQVDAVCGVPGAIVQDGCSGPFAAIINAGMRNLAATRVRGLDLETSYRWATAFGAFGFGASGTYTFNDDLAVTSSAPTFDIVDTVENPLALRVQGTISWSFGGWSANAAINHVGSYTDPGANPVRKVDSWTTVNLGAGYEFSASTGWLSNTRILLSTRNVFDKLPPFVNEPGAFDVANSDLLRRSGSIQIAKRW